MEGTEPNENMSSSLNMIESDNDNDEEGADDEDSLASDKILDAGQVFVLMSKQFRLSRNARAQWYLSHLSPKILQVQKYEDLTNFHSDLEAVAVVPEQAPDDWDYDVGHLYRYIVTPRSLVHFLSQTYCFTYLLDLSPSGSTPDVLQDKTLVDFVIPALRTSLTNLVRPFFVPGSQLLLRPDIYVTVIAWTPFIAEGAQAVLCQGTLVTPDNVDATLDDIIKRLQILEKRSNEVSNDVHNLMVEMRTEAERLTARLFEEEPNVPRSVSMSSSVATTTADSGFIAMIRTGVLALQLLPRNSSLKIVVITDGMIAAPDINALENLLAQLRKDTIALSFIKLSSTFHPHSNLARIPYEELMEYMALSTYGAYLPDIIEVDVKEYYYVMNIYHEAFLCWGFKKALQGIDMTSEGHSLANFNSLLNLSEMSLDTLTSAPRGRFDGIRNDHFAQTEARFTRKKLDTYVHSSLTSLLSVRLREGYTVNSVRILDEANIMEVKLTLPWKINSFIHYTLQSQWPLKGHKCRILVHLEGVYDTMHDLICNNDVGGFDAKDRNNVVTKFKMTMDHLTHVDKLLVHFENFSANSQHYILPDQLKTGVPVFHYPEYSMSNTPELYIPDLANIPSFLSYWKPISSLELDIWHRWLHAHRIHILLNNDYPLAKHLLLPNSSGRYLNVQCRKAAVRLSDSLKDWSTFVLLENSTYIKFIYPDNDKSQAPSTFYIIHMTSKPPCVIIWLAFPGGTSGSIRHSVVQDIKSMISKLTIKQLQSWRDISYYSKRTQSGEASSCEVSETPACILFKKPVERILIRYDQQPSDFMNLLEPAFDSLNNANGQKLTRRIVNIFGSVIHERPSSGTFLTLSRYLHHRRWIWTVQYNSALTLLPQASIAKILSTLTKVRQTEGFSYAHSKNGIQTMMLELPMSINGDDGSRVSCVVQYVIFPPHSSSGSCTMSTWSDEDQNSEKSDMFNENEDESMQLITEVWVEPQSGRVVGENLAWTEAKGLTFDCIPELVFPIDNEIISCLLTCEHLSLMCKSSTAMTPKEMHEKTNAGTENNALPDLQIVGNRSDCIKPGSEIKMLPIQWNLTMVLAKSKGVEMLCPMFIQNLATESKEFDKSNEELFKEIIEKITKINDREVQLLDREHEEFMKYLNKSSHGRVLNFPQRDPLLPNRRRSSANRKSVSGKNDPVLKWLCFIKGVSNSRCLITMVPKSYVDLKRYLVDDSNLAGGDMETVKIVQKPILPSPKPKEMVILPTNTPDESLTSSDVISSNSVNSSLTNLEIQDIDCSALSSMKQRKRSFITTSKDPPASGDQFRKRVMSSDSITQQNERNRCRSMDNPESNNTSGGAGAPKAGQYNPLRPRTQTHSQIHRLKQQDNVGVRSISEAASACNTKKKPPLPTTATKKPVKKIWGSITLPVLVFDVVTTDVVAHLLHQNNPKFKKHDWLTVKLSETNQDQANTNNGRESPIKKEESENMSEQQQNYPKKHSLFECEKSLRFQCMNLQSIYYRSFVTSVFKSLQLNQSLHSFDVQTAVDNCEENVEEIYFTDFVMKICNHIQIDMDNTSSSNKTLSTTTLNFDPTVAGSSLSQPLLAEEMISQTGTGSTNPNLDISFPISGSSNPNLDISFQSSSCDPVLSQLEDQDLHEEPEAEVPDPPETPPPKLLKVEKILKGKSCTDQDVNHSVIKRKFNDILSNSFQLVPHMTDLYYFCPNLNQIGDDYFPIPSRMRRDTKETGGTGSSNVDESEDLVGKMKIIMPDQDEVEDDISTKKTNTKKDASSLSLLSHETSEQSDLINESREDTLAEFEPLFLQVSICIRHDKDPMITCPISQIPTCLIDLVKNNIDAGEDGSKELDMSKLVIYLDLLKITLSKDIPIEFGTRHMDQVPLHHNRKRSASLCSTLSISEYHRSSSEVSLSSETNGQILDQQLLLLDETLPSQQLDAINNIISEIKWMISDEMAFALTTHTKEITETTLNTVVNHIKNSDSKPGCSVEKIPLNYVKGHDESHELFITMFKDFQIPGWRAIRVREHFMYMKNNEDDGDHPQEEQEGVDDDEDLLVVNESGCQRFQLSPVKEAIAAGYSLPGTSLYTEEVTATTTATINDDDVTSITTGGNTSMMRMAPSPPEAEVFVWHDEPQKTSCRKPQFWLILRISETEVEIYFQYREGQFEAYVPWRQIQKLIVSEVRNICKKVNQRLLLKDMHETKICNRLLEPETSNEEVWKVIGVGATSASMAASKTTSRHNSLTAAVTPREDDDDEEEVTYLEANLNPSFRPGIFACPVVWETDLSLHPRLREPASTNQANLGSRGLHVTRMVLNTDSVTNRKNMFAYKDDCKNIFYIKVSEVIRDTGLSRCSSVSSSFYDLSQVDDLVASKQSKPEDRLELKIHGIDEVGPNVKHDLVSFLKKRLDEKVVDILSTLLLRNPMSKLTPEDVLFLQKDLTKPSNVVKFRLNPASETFLEALQYYLRQNVVAGGTSFSGTIVPKYYSQRFIFRDFLEKTAVEVSSADIFLYNNSATAGRRGLAVFSMSIIDGQGHLLHSSSIDDLDRSLNLEFLQTFVQVEKLSSDEEMEKEGIFLQFRLWEQGRIDMEDMVERFEAIVKHALWEVVTEYYLMPNDLMASTSSISNSSSSMSNNGTTTTTHECLNTKFCDFARQWFDLGLELKVSSLNKSQSKYISYHSALKTVKELRRHFNLVSADLKIHTFQQFRAATSESPSIYFPSQPRHGSVSAFPPSPPNNNGSEYYSKKLKDNFILIGRNLKHWKACKLAPTSIDAEVLAPKEMRSLKRFQPLIVLPASADDSTSKCTFIPRQRLLLCYVYKGMVCLYSYNCSRDIVERFQKNVTQLGHWFNARAALPLSIVSQKLGIFHNNQAFYRQKGGGKTAGRKNSNPYLGNDSQIEALVTNFSAPTTTTTATSSTTALQHANSAVSKWDEEALNSILYNTQPPRPLMNRRRLRAYSTTSTTTDRDVIRRQGRQILEILNSERLTAMAKVKKWITSTTASQQQQQPQQSSSSSITDEDMMHFQQMTKLVHFLYTPLLFLPRWRYYSHATRLRFKQDILPSTKASQSGLKVLRVTSNEEREHVSTVKQYMHDYVKYLNSHGFTKISTTTEANSKLGGGHRAGSRSSASSKKNQKQQQNPQSSKRSHHHHHSPSTVLTVNSNSAVSTSAASKYPLASINRGRKQGESIFVKKIVAGCGIILFELGVCEPFVYMKIHALEDSSLSDDDSNAIVVENGLQNSTLIAQIGELQKIVHMHSFTFDYHLRVIHQLVTGKPILRKGYHLVHFLGDFMMYYHKGPNFARNCIHTGTIDIPCTQEWINSSQLYNYVLSHEAVYQFRVLRMEPLYVEQGSTELELEYALVRYTRCQLAFRFPDQFKQNTDEVDVTLVVSHDLSDHQGLEKTRGDVLRLRYYLVFSRKEFSPTSYDNNKQSGIFRPVIKSSLKNSIPKEARHSHRAEASADLSKMMQVTATNVNTGGDIQNEKVNYMGYYSTHEQSMETVVDIQSKMTESDLKSIFSNAAVHCRRDQLWKHLHDGDCDLQRFSELMAFVHTESQLTAKCRELSHLIRGRGLSWFKSLSKFLGLKYERNLRFINDPHAQIEHVVILSDKYMDMATVATFDVRRGCVEFNVINRFAEVGQMLAHIKRASNDLAESIFGDVCFHLWQEQFTKTMQ